MIPEPLRVTLAVARVFERMGIPYFVGGSLAWRNLRPSAETRPGVSGIFLPDSGGLRIDPGASAVYILDERDVERAFKRAKDFLLDYRDNPACLEINRILLSNASAAVMNFSIA